MQLKPVTHYALPVFSVLWILLATMSSRSQLSHVSSNATQVTLEKFVSVCCDLCAVKWRMFLTPSTLQAQVDSATKMWELHCICVCFIKYFIIYLSHLLTPVTDIMSTVIVWFGEWTMITCCYLSTWCIADTLEPQAHDTRQIKIGRYCRPTKICRVS